MKTVFQTEIGFEIKVEQYNNGKFRVTYGKQISDKLTYEKAAKELGECLFHALSCEGRLDND